MPLDHFDDHPGDVQPGTGPDDPAAELARDHAHLDRQFAAAVKVIRLLDALGADRRGDETAAEWVARRWRYIRPRLERVAALVARWRRLDGRPPQ